MEAFGSSQGLLKEQNWEDEYTLKGRFLYWFTERGPGSPVMTVSWQKGQESGGCSVLQHGSPCLVLEPRGCPEVPLAFSLHWES